MVYGLENFYNIVNKDSKSPFNVFLRKIHYKSKRFCKMGPVGLLHLQQNP